MQRKSRFIKSVVETARKTQVEMPWTRGNRRFAFSNGRRTGIAADQALSA